MRSKTPSRARSSRNLRNGGLVLKAVTGKRRLPGQRRFLREPLLVLQVEYDTRIPEGPCLALADGTVQDLITVQACHGLLHSPVKRAP